MKMNDLHRARVLLVACLAVASLSSCAGNPWKRTLRSSGNGMALFEERKFDESGKRIALGYAHPIAISHDRLGAVLSKLSFTQRHLLVGDENGAVFSREEVERLATPLAAALAELAPDSRLRFLLVRDKGKFFLARQLGTSGVIFATAANELNIAFDMVRENVVIEDGSPEDVRFGDDPTTLVTDDFQIHLPRDDSFRRAAGAPNGGWIVVNPAAIKPPEVEKVAVVPEPAPKLADPAPPTAEPDSPTAEPRPAVSPSPGRSEGSTPPIAKREGPQKVASFTYKGFTVFERGGRAYAIATSEGPVDPARLARGEYKTLIERESIEKVIESIEAIRDSIR